MSSPLFARDKQAVRVSNMIDFSVPTPPYRWVESCGDGVISTGSIPHFIKRIFQDLDIKSEWIMGETSDSDISASFKSKYQQLRSGELDFLLTPIKPSQHDGLITGSPLFILQSKIITSKNRNIAIDQIDALKPYTGGAVVFYQEPNAVHQYLKQKQLQLKEFSSQSKAFKSLLKGDIDYLIGDRYLTKIWELENNKQGSFTFSKISLPARNYYLTTTKNNPYSNLIPKINQRIMVLNDNGFLEYLHGIYLKKWSLESCE